MSKEGEILIQYSEHYKEKRVYRVRESQEKKVCFTLVRERDIAVYSAGQGKNFICPLVHLYYFKVGF